MGLSQAKIKELLANNRSRWEVLEDWLLETEPEKFTNAQLSKSLKLPSAAATRMIRAYLDVQRRENSETLYVLKRQGKTRWTIWVVHNRKGQDLLDEQLFDDLKTRVMDAYVPDTRRLAELEPRLRRRCERRIDWAINTLIGSVRVIVDDAFEGE